MRVVGMGFLARGAGYLAEGDVSPFWVCRSGVVGRQIGVPNRRKMPVTVGSMKGFLGRRPRCIMFYGWTRRLGCGG